MAVVELDERRLLAAPLVRERAAGPEAAAGRRVEQRRRAARDARRAARSSKRTPTSGSEPISSRVYGCRGDLTIVSAGAFSASWPAYMIMIVSAIW